MRAKNPFSLNRLKCYYYYYYYYYYVLFVVDAFFFFFFFFFFFLFKSVRDTICECGS